jgi:IS6 family transposase
MGAGTLPGYPDANLTMPLAERGVLVDQSTIYRCVQRFLPLFGEVARRYRELVGPDWRVDETYARIRGRWHYIYRAIDGLGQIVDAYVSPTRDAVAAQILRASDRYQRDNAASCHHRQSCQLRTSPRRGGAGVLHRAGRYRTNGIERDHGFLKERLRPMRGLKSAASAAIFMRGHALMRNILRRFYRVVESVPRRLLLPWTWNGLAEAV